MDRGAMLETPKAGDVCFERANFQLVLGMHELFPRGAPHRGIRRLPGVLRQFHRRLAASKKLRISCWLNWMNYAKRTRATRSRSSLTGN